MPIALPALPPLEVLLFASYAGTALFFLLSACFAPLLAAASESLAVSRGRAFYKKTARQLAAFSLVIAAPACVATLGFTARTVFDYPYLLEAPYRIPLFVLSACTVASLLFLLSYLVFWNPAVKANFFHVWIGIKAWSVSLFTLFLAMGFLRRLLHTPLPSPSPELGPFMVAVDFFAIPFDSLLWPLFLVGIAVGCAGAGCLGMLWILLLRLRLDLGRDYYNFALPYCARWALAGTLLSLPLAIWAYFFAQGKMLPELSHEPSNLLALLSLAMPLLACLCWIPLCRSKTPLRHKAGMVMAFLFLLAGLIGQVLVFNKILPSP